MATVPTLTLNNGVQLPAIGLGVFQTPPDETTSAVEAALTTGYRHIDTAAAYGNEREVGEGIRRSGVPREEMFIETKIWISDYGYDATLHGFDKSAGKLGVDQIDLLILHQALPSRFELTLDAYRALEKLLADGNVRAIGVSNFMPEHLQRLLDETDVVRLVQSHQVEVWRYLRYLGASAELADDLVQEAFLQLLRAPFEERTPAATAGWLRTVARNQYIRSFRVPPFQPAELDAIEAGWTGFAGEDGGQETLERLRACLERLDGRAREAVRLHYEERRSRRGVGRRLGIGEDGVKSLLRRTRALLRDCVERKRVGA